MLLNMNWQTFARKYLIKHEILHKAFYTKYSQGEYSKMAGVTCKSTALVDDSYMYFDELEKRVDKINLKKKHHLKLTRHQAKPCPPCVVGGTDYVHTLTTGMSPNCYHVWLWKCYWSNIIPQLQNLEGRVPQVFFSNMNRSGAIS